MSSMSAMAIARRTKILAGLARPVADQRVVSARLRLLLLIVLINTSCSEDRVPVEVSFDARFQGRAISCTTEGTSLTDLRFFVSELALIDEDGISHPVPMLRDDRWQTREVALIDLENGQGRCVNGTRDIHSSITGTAAVGRYVGLSFVVGVPFDLNHANPLLAEAPLNDAAMHWHWRSGYKFLRAGIATPSDAFWIHLGSTACQGTVRNVTGCQNPNRVAVTVVSDHKNAISIAINISTLTEGVDLADGHRTDCSSGPSESNCESVFDSLGLNFLANGKTRQQRVFQASR